MMAQAQAKLCSAGLQEPGMPWMAPPNFYKFVNPILIMGGRLCLPHYYCPPLLQTFLRPCSERESSACRLNWGTLLMCPPWYTTFILLHSSLSLSYRRSYTKVGASASVLQQKIQRHQDVINWRFCIFQRLLFS